MIIECTNCHARYQYNEDRFERKPSKKIKCAKCGTIFEIHNPAFAEKPAPAAMPERPHAGDMTFARNATALADAELEYKDVEDPSIYVEFPATDPAAVQLAFRTRNNMNVFFLVWTTTHCTLHSTLAIAVLKAAVACHTGMATFAESSNNPFGAVET